MASSLSFYRLRSYSSDGLIHPVTILVNLHRSEQYSLNIHLISLIMRFNIRNPVVNEFVIS